MPTLGQRYRPEFGKNPFLRYYSIYNLLKPQYCQSYLRELIRIMLPKFFDHLSNYMDSMELLFCHRWILLCFKREFTEAVAIRMWEACWSNYLTDYFHLFLCLGIMAVYADDVIAQNLTADEMLLYFSSLGGYFT